MEDQQWPVLGPTRMFERTTSPFIQILHTGNSHWICVNSLGVDHGTVNLYDSLFHYVIEKVVEEKVINLVGQSNYFGVQVISVQQQNNGSDCEALQRHLEHVWHTASNHKQRNLIFHKWDRILKSGMMKLFPTCQQGILKFTVLFQ